MQKTKAAKAYLPFSIKEIICVADDRQIPYNQIYKLTALDYVLLNRRRMSQAELMKSGRFVKRIFDSQRRIISCGYIYNMSYR